jgi:hypothetical protein
MAEVMKAVIKAVNIAEVAFSKCIKTAKTVKAEKDEDLLH